MRATVTMALLLTLPAAPARAALMEWHWTGRVVEAAPSLLGDPGSTPPYVHPGTAVAFSVVMDTSAPNVFCASTPGAGFYSAPRASRLRIGGFSFASQGGGLEVNSPLGNTCLPSDASEAIGDLRTVAWSPASPNPFGTYFSVYQVIAYVLLPNPGGPLPTEPLATTGLIVRLFGGDLSVGELQFHATPVAEPSTTALALAALAGLVLRRVRR